MDDTGNAGKFVGISESAPNFTGKFRVYQNLVLVLRRQADLNGDQLLRETLQAVDRSTSSPSIISALIKCQDHRIQLFQIALDLGISDHKLVHNALAKDHDDLGNLLRAALCSERLRQLALDSLRGEDAQRFLDMIQDALDHGSLLASLDDDDELNLQARLLLVRLSAACDRLPSCLFIQGVRLQGTHPICGGSFGDIYRAIFASKEVALKRMRVFQKDRSWHRTRQLFCREAVVWQRLRHPFVLPFLGIDSESFPGLMCLVSPWMRHGTILDHLANNGKVNIVARLHEISCGIEYLHSQNIVHGDLRGANIFIDDDCHVRIADFGLTVFSDSTATGTSHRGGSIRWMAPELLYPEYCGFEKYQRTFQSDVYAFACLCLELYTGIPPFATSDAHEPSVMFKVIGRCRPDRPTGMPQLMWGLIGLCWQHSPAARLRVPQIVAFLSTITGIDPGVASKHIPIHNEQTTRLFDDAVVQLDRAIYSCSMDRGVPLNDLSVDY